MGRGRPREHQVILRHGYCMAAHEVTVAEYAACVAAGSCEATPEPPRPPSPNHPQVMVTWKQARAYCAWVRGHLPTEAQWEWAATGPEQYRYPWGNEPEPTCEHVAAMELGIPPAAALDRGERCDGEGPWPVGSRPGGDRVWPDGAIHDLAGNVWEWVEDSFGRYAPSRGGSPQTDPRATARTGVRVLRGGGWDRPRAALDVTYRSAAGEDFAAPTVGFRCVKPAP